MSQNNSPTLSNTLLAILFVEPDFVSYADLSAKLGVALSDITNAINELNAALSSFSLFIYTTENKARLLTKPEYADQLKSFCPPKPRPLPDSALETLLIIVDRMPATKTEIDDIRGADSEYALQLLLKNSLIKKIGDMKRPGAPALYSITDQCLSHFGLKSAAELRAIVQDYKNQIINSQSLLG